MLNRKLSFRFALTLVALIAISTVTATANWGSNWNVLEFLGITEATSPISETTPESTTAPAVNEPAMFVGPLTGTLNVPGDYPTLAAAIMDLNTEGVASGGATINLLAGNPQTAPAGGYAITRTDITSTNSISIVGNGNTVTAFTPQTVASTFDAIFKIVGSDFVTISGFTMAENAGNVVTTPIASNTMTEFGVLLVHASATDGAQNNTIQNNTIALNSAYTNSVGIFSTSSSSSVNGAQDATSTAGTNSNNKIYSNIISNVAYGIGFICPPITATVFETGNDIGGSGAGTANTITFGNAVASSGPWNRSQSTQQSGIFFRNGAGNNIRFNSVTSNTAAYVGSAGLNGILINSSTTPTGVTYTSTISDNTVNITSTGIALLTGIDFGHGISTGTIVGSNNNITINQTAGAAVLAALIGIKGNYASATNTLNTNSVTVNQNQSAAATTSAVTGITGAGIGTTVSVNSNTITFKQNAPTGAGSYGSGAMTFIDVGAASGAVTANSNMLLTTASTIRSTGTCIGINHTSGTITVGITLNLNTITIDRVAASGTITGTNESSTPSTVAHTITNNGITFTNLAGTTVANGISTLGGPGAPAVNNKTIDGNTISISGTHTGTTIGITCRFTNTGFIRNNPITITSAAPNVTGITTSGTTMTVSGNTLSLASSTTSPTTMYGISESGTGAHSITNNTFSAMNFTGIITGSPEVSAIVISAGTVANVFGNTITNVSVGAATSTASPIVDGIQIFGGNGVNVFKNRIYGLTTAATGSSTMVSGIRIFFGGTTNPNNIYNNLIGKFVVSAASSAIAQRGINITSTVALSTHNVYYNTVYLDGSGGANYGGAALFHAGSATASTSNLNLRNNILVNLMTASGTGAAAAYQRSGAAGTLANYASTSNNNLFYAGTPSALSLIYYDNSNAIQTLALYKTGVPVTGTIATRDAASISEDPEFQSTVGANANFLKFRVTAPKFIESGASNVAGITDDFAGTIRAGNGGYAGTGSNPDVGAWELEGMSAGDFAGPSITYTNFANTTSTANRTLTATITDATGVNLTPGSEPRIYFRKGTSGAYTPAACSGPITGNALNGTYDCVIDHSAITAAGGDTVQYYVAAQDTLLNVSTSPGGGSGTTPPGTTAPGSPNSYVILLVVSAYPYSQDFNTNEGGYTAGNTIGAVSDWQFGTFAKTQITGPRGGSGNAWVTKLVGTYTTSTSSTLNSPIFNFSSLTVIQPTLTFWHNFKTEAGFDAGVLEMSTNGGTVWTKVDATLGLPGAGVFTTPSSTFWYNSSSTNGAATGVTQPKFSGTSTAYTGHALGWVKSTSLLPVGVLGQADVRFRWVFGADNSTNDEGWAIDDVSVSADDVTAPVITYTALANTTSGANRTQTISVTDNVGVGTGGGLPVLYFRKGTVGAYTAGACAPAVLPNYDCTIDHSAVGGVIAGDTIQYYVAAQDTAATPNVSVNPSAGASGFTATPPAVSTPPTTPSSYLIAIGYSGSVNVGTGEAITSLTNSGGLFSLLNVGVLTGHTTINLTSDLIAETGTVSLNQLAEEGVGGYTLTILPSATPRIVSGSSSSCLINLNGADRVVFDGAVTGTAKDTTYSNTNSNGATVCFANAATNNTFKNSIIRGVSTSNLNGVVFFSTVASGTTGNSNNTIQNNDISGGASAPNYTVFNSGTSTAKNASNTITQNRIFNFSSTGIRDDGNSAGATYSNNEIFEVTTQTTSLVGFRPSSTSIDGFTFTRNNIHDLNTTSNVSVFGIHLFDTSTLQVSTVSNNFISLGATTPLSLRGIYDQTAVGEQYNIYFNTVQLYGTVTGISNSEVYYWNIASTSNVRNNIFKSSRVGGTGKHYVYRTNTTLANLISDYNDIYAVGAIFGNNGTADVANLTDWKSASPTGTGKDANSIALDPEFRSATDLHIKRTDPAVASPVEDAGVTIAGVATDYDGDTRHLTTPDIGADEAKGINLSAATYSSGSEGNMLVQATITVNRAADTGSAASIAYATTDGTATGGAACTTPGVEDYITAAGTLNFAAGELSKTLMVDVCPDTIYEGDETINITLSDAGGGSTLVTPSAAVLTITEDEVIPTVSVNDHLFAAQSVAAGGGFTVTLSGPSGTTVLVPYSSGGGSATGGAGPGCSTGDDYISVSGTLSFAPGDVSEEIPVTICTDTVQEPTETFNLTLGTPTGATILDGVGVGTISSEDLATASVGTPAAQLEGNSPATSTMTFPVMLDNPVSTAVTINYTVTPGTATTPSDYASSGTSIIIPANTTTGSIDVTVNGDTDYEANEAFTVTITSGDVLIGTATGTGTITNDDNPPGTLVVTNTTDNDGVCLPLDCSLRQAINTANANADVSTINFAIPNTDPGFVGGVYTIRPTSQLPSTNQPAIVAGESQMGYVATPVIEISGDLAPDNTTGFFINGSNTTVSKLAVNNFLPGLGVGMSTGSNNTVSGMHIGVNAAGTVAAPNNVGYNQNFAVDTIFSGNVISGHTNSAVGGGWIGGQIINNLIGTDKNGTIAIPNGDDGIFMSGNGVLIKGNTISGNLSTGLILVATNSTVHGNFIGTDSSGTVLLGNGDQGVQLTGNGNIVGGSGLGEANIIANNTGNGLIVFGTSSSIRANSIVNNTGLGIDLGNDGLTPNDPNDADAGPNNYQNFPVLTSAEDTGSTSHIVGTLNSTASTTFAVDVYSNDACDGTGYGEGKVYLGSFNVTTDAFGDVSFDHTGIAITTGKFLTATATDPSGNTSEFSQCQQVVGGTTGTIEFSAGTYSASESSSDVVVTFVRTGGSDGSISATFSTSDGTAIQPGDYDEVLADVITFTDGDVTPKVITYSIINDDSTHESTESFQIAINNQTTNLGSAPLSATVNITDNDAAPIFGFVSLGQDEGNVGNGTASVTVTKTGATEINATLDYMTVAGTATPNASCGAGFDFIPTSGTLTFLPNETSKLVSVTICGDLVYEANETYSIPFTNPVGGTILIGTGTSNNVIQNDDTAPTISVNDYTFSGQSGIVEGFTVSLSGNATELPVTVNYQSNDATATGGATCTGSADYEITSGMLTFNPGTTSLPINVNICPDSVQEPTETFEMNLSSPSGATFGDNQGIGTIQSDDSSTASIGNVTQVELNSSTSTFSFAVTLDNPVSTAVTINYTVTPGTATTPSDYTSSGTSIIIPANTTTGSIDVTVNGDTDYEADEAFTVTIASGDVLIGTGTGTGTITNDDNPPGTLVVTNTTDNDGVCLPLDCSLRQAINSANANADVNTITFNIPGAGPDVITIGATGVLAINQSVSIQGPTVKSTTVNGTAANPTRIFLITAGTVGISNLTVSGARFGSGGGVFVQGANVTLQNMLFSNNTIGSSGSGGGAGVSGGTLSVINSTFSNNSAVNGGALYNGSGTLNLLNVTVTNNDATGDLGGGPCQIASEGGGLDNFGGNPTSIRNSIIANNTACNPSFPNISGTFTDLGNNITSGDPLVGPLQNNGGPTFTRALQALSPAIDTGNDCVLTLNGCGSNPAITTDQRGVSRPRGVRVDIGAFEVDACVPQPANMVAWYSGENHFRDIQGPTFENGAASGGTVGFTTGKVGQAFNFTASGFANMGTPAPLVITGNQITLDGWVRPTTVSDAVYFGRSASGANDYLLLNQFGGLLSGMIKTSTGETIVNAPSGPPVGQWSHIALTYDGAMMRLYMNGLQVGSTPKTGNITNSGQPFGIGGRTTGLKFNGAADEVEVFNRALSASEVANLYNSDIYGKCKSGLIEFTSPTYTIGEGGTNASITVRRTDGSVGAVSATFNTSNGTATTAGLDYTTTSTTVNFANGDSADKTVLVPINDDGIDEVDETVNVALTSATGGAFIGSQATGVLTITDNDTAAASIGDVTQAETTGGTTTFSFPVTLTLPVSTAVTVNYTVTPGTATTPSDYTSSGTSIIIPANTTAGSIDVTVNGDNEYEPNEAFTVTITSTQVAIGTGTGTGTITNDDLQPVLAFSSVTYNGNEGTSATITVNRTGAAGNAVSVNYATGGGTAMAGVCGSGGDYVATSGTLNLAANQMSNTFSVVLCTDVVTETPETVGLTLTSPGGGAALGVSAATLTIIDPAVGGAGFEGDVMGGASPGIGNGAFDSGDVTRVRRLVTGLSTPNLTVNEFQRADSAPYIPSGDGRLTSGDVTVARRFVAGDLSGVLKPAGGPISPVMFAPLFEEYDEIGKLIDNSLRQTEMRIVGGEARRGENVTVAVELDQRGTENAFSYTLHFDPTQLSMRNGGVAVSALSSVNGGLLTVNYDDLANGNIGILLDMPAGQVIVPGEARHTILLTFYVPKGAAAGETPITFTSDLVEQYLSDMNGDPLFARFTPGSVRIGVGSR